MDQPRSRARPKIQRPHWSYSQLNQYRRCPLQYYFERIQKIPIPFTASALAFGSSIHAALADFHQLSQARGATSRERLEQTFLASWAEIDNFRPIQLKAEESEAALLEKGCQLLHAYFESFQPREILAVEQLFLVPIQNSQGEILERPLVVVIDLLVREQELIIVEEFKTSSRKLSQFEIDMALQATCYTLAIQDRFSCLATVQYTTLVKTQQPQIQRLTTHRDEKEFPRLGDLVENIERAMSAAAYFPIENPQNCSTCPFRKPCRDWSGGKVEDLAFETSTQEESLC